MSPGTSRTRRTAWLDVTAGVSGDMLLAALVGAGADLSAMQAAVDAVIPDTVRLVASTVRRAGLAASRIDVEVLRPDQPHRTWSDIRGLLDAADLTPAVRTAGLDAFRRLADVEGAVHGVPAGDVAFHEVGAWDSIADIVGVCAGFEDLGVTEVVASRVGVGSGQVRAAHGTLPVPVPAVVGLLAGWSLFSGASAPTADPGELATPTGVALLRALCERQGPVPPMTPVAQGLGAGSRDPVDHPNVVRLVLGDDASHRSPGDDLELRHLVVLEANVDDLDPRVWATVLDNLLAAGAADAWLTPILMKKGRPAHTLSVLADPADLVVLRDLVLDETSTLGVRELPVPRWALARVWVDVDVAGVPVAVKVAHRGGAVVHATAELTDAAHAAEALGRPLREVLEITTAATVRAGIVRGAPLPGGTRSTAGR